MDDPDDFDLWLLDDREHAGRGVMTRLKLHLKLRFLRLLLFQDQTCAMGAETRTRLVLTAIRYAGPRGKLAASLFPS